MQAARARRLDVTVDAEHWSSSRTQRATSRTRENGAPSIGSRSMAAKSASSRRLRAREPRILRDDGELDHVEQRRAAAAHDPGWRRRRPGTACGARRAARRRARGAGRTRALDPVGQAPHHQRAIADHRQDAERDSPGLLPRRRRHRHERADAVVLQLVDEVRIRQRRVRLHRQHRLHRRHATRLLAGAARLKVDELPGAEPVTRGQPAADLEHVLLTPATSRADSVFGSAFWTMPAMRQSALMKIMSSGISVFFIQNTWCRALFEMNSIPASGSRCSRNMRPRSCSSGVIASSTLNATLLSPVSIVTIGVARARGLARGQRRERS